MKLKPGTLAWIPCEVKPGPFTNERTVRVESTEGVWIGFVDVEFLKDPVPSGKTYLRAFIVEVGKDHFKARLPGHPVGASSLYQGRTDRVALDPLPA
jgi:hypothetical protein